MALPYRCTMCANPIFECGTLHQMKSHLGAPGTHNMGPFECQIPGCSRRTQRTDRNSTHTGHTAIWARSNQLENQLNAAAAICHWPRVPVAAAVAAAAPLAPLAAHGAAHGTVAPAGGQAQPPAAAHSTAAFAAGPVVPVAVPGGQGQPLAAAHGAIALAGGPAGAVAVSGAAAGGQGQHPVVTHSTAALAPGSVVPVPGGQGQLLAAAHGATHGATVLAGAPIGAIGGGQGHINPSGTTQVQTGLLGPGQVQVGHPVASQSLVTAASPVADQEIEVEEENDNDEDIAAAEAAAAEAAAEAALNARYEREQEMYYERGNPHFFEETSAAQDTLDVEKRLDLTWK